MTKPRVRLFNDRNVALVQHGGFKLMVGYIRAERGKPYEMPVGCASASFHSLEHAIKTAIRAVTASTNGARA